MENTATKTILAVSGSIRKPSTQEAILKIIEGMLPSGTTLSLYPGIDRLPWFNPDLDAEGTQAPESVRDFRERIEKADGVLICTPEYVFSLPGSLKNALEWTVSQEVFSCKPVAFVVAAASGEKAFESLDLILKTLTQRPVPEACRLLIRGSRGKFTQGALIDESLRQDLRTLMEALWGEMNRPELH